MRSIFSLVFFAELINHVFKRETWRANIYHEQKESGLNSHANFGGCHGKVSIKKLQLQMQSNRPA
jgi:hypothetical protein